MLSIGIVSSGGGLGYYLQTVGSGVDDYYARSEPGRWIGAGAANLGLTGTVDASQVDALATGLDPTTGAPLGVRVGKVAAFDLTFSSPKSVSLLAELGDEPTRRATTEAHARAVEATLEFLEGEGVLVGRRGPGGLHSVGTVGAVAAAFDHRTSRAGDPHLHTHVLVLNRALGSDGRWGGLDGRRIFGWAKTAGYVYQSALRAELSERLGVEWRPPTNGMAEMVGIGDGALSSFSRRRSEIEAALAATGHSSVRAAQLATLSTRPAKPKPLDAEVQRIAWREQAASVGIDADVLYGLLGRSPGSLDLRGWDVRAAAGDMAAPAGLTAHRSSFDRRDVIRDIAQAQNWRPHEVAEATEAVLAWHQFSPTGRESRLAGPLYSTVDLMETERRLVEMAARPGDPYVVAREAAIEAALHSRPTLSAEQEGMVRRLCGPGRMVEVVVGRAGTGKTYALDACRQAWTDSGVAVVGAALAARTAAALQSGTGIPSATVDQLLADLDRPGPHQALPRRGVLVIDEAGLVGTRKLAGLVEAAERAHCRVVLVGDPKQLPEVEAGGLFAVLATDDPVHLTINRRQEQSWERAALDELRHGEVAKAVVVYRDRQRITLTGTAEEARAGLVADWWAAGHDPERHLMVALHQVDVDDLNQRARRLLQDVGELNGPSVESADAKVFAVGDYVMALRNDRRIGVTNGTRATVIAVDQELRELTVETPDGRSMVIPSEYLDAGHVGYGYSLTAHKSQGLTVDRAFVLGSDRMYREAGYVAMSRARDRSDLYQVAPPPSRFEPAELPDPFRDLALQLTRSGAQTPALTDLTLDRRAIRDAALADPGQHLIDRLGPPPPAGPARDAWAAAATATDAYRVRHHVDGPEPLGPRPTSPDLVREWEHAQALVREIDRSQQVDIGRDISL